MSRSVRLQTIPVASSTCSADSHFKVVIVSMPKRVVALAVYGRIFRSGQTVRCSVDARRKTYSGVSDVPSCFTVEIDKQIRRLVHPNPMKLRSFHLGRQPLPDSDRQVFGGRNFVGKFRHFFVKKAMVDRIDNFAVQDLLQLLQIDNKSRTADRFRPSP